MTEQQPLKQNTIIQLKDVFKYFIVGDQKIPVLKDINAEIHSGDFTIIFGPSGCGKSTILHTLLGLEPPTQGTVSIKGRDLYSRSADEISDERKRHFGTIYQQSNWIGALSVLENVSFPLSLRGEDKHIAMGKALEQLKSVGMEGWANHRPTELSAGQQQKVSLARCLITEPDLIIADEPTGNLDEEAAAKVRELLFELQQEFGTSLLVATHNLELAACCGRTLQLHGGRLVQDSNTAPEA